ncbi:MAG: IS3 family transposase [Chromatiales bacterium]|nr:MAG: IS3 family transposase [Chromatiales bacterium]
MATTISPAAGRRYGVARVCEAWDLPRSSFYAARQQPDNTAGPPAKTQRRGPKPAVSDEALLAAIRADLTRPPWTGEGHRKVWARLRVIDTIRVARKRVLRVMREHSLLSPHRARTRSEAPHERHIITQAPNVMWATDATQITTVQDGKVWLFGVIEHWNAELVGWHVAKRGTRFEATQAVCMAVHQQFGHISPGAARGLALRHDHGSNFMADHFQKQIRSWGIAPSYAFVGEPETNGVIERFFRTFKEQVTHGRIYQTIDDVRDAVRSFVTQYNAKWLIEKIGYISPTQARNAWNDAALRSAA